MVFRERSKVDLTEFALLVGFCLVEIGVYFLFVLENIKWDFGVLKVILDLCAQKLFVIIFGVKIRIF
jgi:hypothetical protein